MPLEQPGPVGKSANIGCVLKNSSSQIPSYNQEQEKKEKGYSEIPHLNLTSALVADGVQAQLC